MKKLLISLMITVFALSVFSAFALADSVVGSADLIIEADTTNVTLDSIGATGTINLTIKIKPSGPITFGNISFKLKLPDGNFSIKSTIDPAFSSVGLSSFENGVFLITSAGVPISSETTLGTAVVTIQNEAASTNKTYEIGFEEGVNLRDSTPGGTGVVTPVPKNLTGITVTHGPNGHNHSGSQTLAPTCTTQGTMHYTCPCGDEYDDSIPATGHELTFGPFQWADAQDGIENDTAKVHVTCSHGNCKEYGNGGKDVDVPKENIKAHSTGASCTEASTATYEASLTIKDEYRTQAADNFDPATQTWTVTDNSHKHSNATPLGHQWSADNINWSAWNKNSPDTQFDVTLKCGRCDVILTKPVTATKKEASHLDPTCEKDGKDIYEATVDFTGEDKQEQSKDNVPKNVTHEFTDDPITIPATGHDWDAPTWTWSGTKSTDIKAKATIACKNENCDGGDQEGGYKTNPLSMNVDVKWVKDTKPVKCLTDGEATYEATATHPAVTGGPGPYTSQKTDVILPMTGHTLGNVTFDWGDADGKTQPNPVTVTAVCTNENCDNNHTLQPKDNTVAVTEVREPADNWVEPTYGAAGKHTYKASAEFENIGTDKATETKDEVKLFDLPALEPTVKEPTVQNGATSLVDAPTKDALPTEDYVKSQVEAAIKGGATSLDPTLAAALERAAGSTSNDMEVDTKLIVQDKNQQATVSPVEGQEVLQHVYNIYIEVTVTGGGLGTRTGYITEIPQALGFDLDLEGDGPIYVVKRYHNAKWSVIPSSVNASGDKVHFDSSLFSEFALISSSDLKYATIEPIPDQTYTGSAIQPKLKVTINGGTVLEEGTHYTVEYGNNVNVGNKTATATIKFVDGGGYSGEQTVNFSIVAKPAAASNNNNAKTAPETGDETPVALYAGILTLSAAALAVVCIRRKKTH